MRWNRLAWFLIWSTPLASVSAFAQDVPNVPDLAAPRLDGGDKAPGVTASFIADVTKINPTKPFTIGVKLDVRPGFHTFYRSPGGVALPTKIEFSGPQGFQIGPIQFPAPTLEITKIPVANGKQEVEIAYVYEHSTVIWASVTPLSSAPLKEAEFSVQISFQYCKNQGACFPPNPEKLTLKLPVGSRKDPIKQSGDEVDFAKARANMPMVGSESDIARTYASVAGGKLEPGGKGELTVGVQIDNGWFIPMNRPEIENVESTEIIVHEIPGIRFGAPIFAPTDEKPEFIAAFKGLKGYVGGKFCSIRIPFEVTKEFRGNSAMLSGLLRCQPIGFPDEKLPVRYLTFSTLACNLAEPPAPATATPATLPPSAIEKLSNSVAEKTLPNIEEGSPMSAIQNPAEAKYAIATEPEKSIAAYLLFAFLGGLILNIMPCVLPVIAIKVLSFVQQAGESRQRIFLLNLFYAFGVISVFLTLATLSVTASLKWGESFQSPEFNIVMAGVIFAMGLSLLGVFEIPIPGMVGSAGGHQEGLTGAFMTGILATLLATPCSAPFLGTALTWSLKQPIGIRFPIWAMMGLGMSSPYLLLGIFPAAIRWLPKPGEWMVNFKEFTGLILMATVIYLVTLVDASFTVPVLVMLVGLAISFWMIGSLYTFESPAKDKWMVRIAAFFVASGAGYLAFGPILSGTRESQELSYLARVRREGGKTVQVTQIPGNGRIEFEPYGDGRLQELLNQGKSVMIDFTADWCTTCRFVEKTAINTYETEALFEEYDMAALVADRTKPIPELENALTRFGGDAIPYLVLLSAKDPTKPVILKEFYTKADLLEKIREVGPSKSAARK